MLRRLWVRRKTNKRCTRSKSGKNLMDILWVRPAHRLISFTTIIAFLCWNGQPSASILLSRRFKIAWSSTRMYLVKKRTKKNSSQIPCWNRLWLKISHWTWRCCWVTWTKVNGSTSSTSGISCRSRRSQSMTCTAIKRSMLNCHETQSSRK